MYRMLRVLQMSRDATYSYTFDATLTPCKESKTVLDSGFHTVDSGFQVLDSSLCQWNLESGLQLFVGFGFIELYSGFQSPGLRILKHNFAGFRNPNSLTLGGNSLIDNNRAKKH